MLSRHLLWSRCALLFVLFDIFHSLLFVCSEDLFLHSVACLSCSCCSSIAPLSLLQILYEVFPMSYVMEQAGGQAFTGKQRALDLVPRKIHDRSPIFLGSYDDVEQIKALYSK